MCVFCEIIKGNIPSYKLYEDEKCIAILDISQATIGHTLIIPKKHFKNIFELDEETAKHLAIVTTKLAKRIKDALNLEGMNVLNNAGIIAGQTIDHFHIHLIPRYKDDNFSFNISSNKLSEDEFKELVKKITK